MFLKLNDIDSHNHVSQNMLLVNVIDQLLQLDFEHSSYQIQSILRLLSGQQCSRDLRPLGIANECNKCIQTIGPSVDCHGILINVTTPLWPSVGVKPNTPKDGDLESFGTPECLELDSKAQNTSR
jgi:hypothetical protein